MQDFKGLMRRIAKPVLFFVIFGVIFIVLSLFTVKVAANNEDMLADRNKCIIKIKKEKKNSIDAVFTGDSESYSAFSPLKMWNETGITSYVCGQSGQRIQETYLLLREMFAYQSPKVVVFETNTMFRSKTGVNGLKESLAANGKRFVPLLRYHDVWKTLLTGKTYPDEHYKGYLMREDIKPYNGRDYMRMRKGKKKITPFVDEYMDKIIKLCEAHGTKLCLVSAPSPKNYNYQKHQLLQKYAQKKNIRYIDLNTKLDELAIDWQTDTRDKGDHLNLSGADKVSSYLSYELQKQYGLKDHRTDQNYQEWNWIAGDYQMRTEEKLKAIRMEK